MGAYRLRRERSASSETTRVPVSLSGLTLRVLARGSGGDTQRASLSAAHRSAEVGETKPGATLVESHGRRACGRGFESRRLHYLRPAERAGRFAVSGSFIARALKLCAERI